MRSQTRGVVVVVECDRRFLVIRRAAGVAAPHAWCFVGGAVEAGESDPDAVVREFREELGATVRPVALEWEYASPDGRLHLAWWRADWLRDALRPNPNEVAEVRWCSLSEIACLPDLLPSNRAYLASVHGVEADPDAKL